jgi:2-keto-3-deoxy-L-rhamnonate aldolase RhmA
MAVKPNKFKQKLLNGEKVVGIALTFPCINVLDIVGNLGFDYVFVEGEHGSFSMQDIEEICIVADAMDLTVHARVPNIQPSTILQFLDRGVQGITGPHIRTAEDARQLAQACRYTPLGVRSFFMNRVAGYIRPDDVPGYIATVNEEIWVTALLEDREAVEENLDGILSVPGIDAVSIGYFDLSQSLGHPGDLKHPEVDAVVEKAWSKIAAAGKASGRRLVDTTRVSVLLKSGAMDFIKKARAAK